MRKCASVEPVAEISGTFERPSNPASTPATRTTSFEYDDYNKLTEITHPDSTTETLSYDDNGQLVRREKSTGEVTGYEWNDQGMLVKVILPGGEPVEYEYDGNQRLISRKSSDGVDNFVQSGWDIMTKMDDVGKRTYYTGMSAVLDEDNQTYFHYNHREDTVLVTDSEGNVLNNFSYVAYGKATTSEGIPVNNLSIKNIPNLFVGASGIRYDTKTDLHYMRFRWFSPEEMRFISPDLLMDLNRYAYVEENPINKIDPSGLQSHWDYVKYQQEHITPYGVDYSQWGNKTKPIPPKSIKINWGNTPYEKRIFIANYEPDLFWFWTPGTWSKIQNKIAELEKKGYKVTISKSPKIGMCARGYIDARYVILIGHGSAEGLFGQRGFFGINRYIFTAEEFGIKRLTTRGECRKDKTVILLACYTYEAKDIWIESLGLTEEQLFVTVKGKYLLNQKAPKFLLDILKYINTNNMPDNFPNPYRVWPEF